MERAYLALDGLSIGDAFGQRFFHPSNVQSLIAERALPQAPWPYTDDTEMALAVTQVLHERGHVHQDELARTFARRYWRNPARGYGGMAHEILQTIAQGLGWRQAASSAFGGQGSMGNGGAMRVAPVGAYFADDYARTVTEARASAEITHSHAEGQAGAIAVAVAAAWAWRVGASEEVPVPARLFEITLEHTPTSATRAGIERARSLALDASPGTAAEVLGSGHKVTAPDTVPFTVWCAARHLDSFTDALWATVAGLGDRDTTCAIVGGIVALAVGRSALPPEWCSAREALLLTV
jgi:ADP-ribosylglycohydrolase